jgi:hypothetical protein
VNDLSHAALEYSLAHPELGRGDLIAFAILVRDKERKRCAYIAESLSHGWHDSDFEIKRAIADAIRDGRDEP